MPMEAASLTNAVIGGSMIGAAGMVMLIFTGKTLGFSGITKGLWANAPDWKWRCMFLGGLMCSSAFIRFTYPVLQEPVSNKDAVFRLLLGGLFVGVGSGLSNGCTSGHGIIGLSRFSIRSITATCLFMFAAVVTASLTNLSAVYPVTEATVAPTVTRDVAIVACCLISLLVGTYLTNRKKIAVGDYTMCGCAMAALGGVAGLGLHLSGMAKPSKIAAFLDLSRGIDLEEGWDPSMLFVMGGAHLIAMPTYHFVVKKMWDGGQGKSLTGQTMGLPSPTSPVDMKLIYGALFFGTGWGLCGLCPGPAHVGLIAPTTGDELLRIFSFQVMMGVGWVVQAAVSNGFDFNAIINAKSC